MADNKATTEQTTQHKFPTEIVDLPSGGKAYPKDSPLATGKLEIKYMTAKEEDILTSQNLIKKGLVIDKLLDALIMTPGIKCDDLILGDKNAIMVAARILAYGPEYTVKLNHPRTDMPYEHTFDLTACPFKDLPEDVDYSNNQFDVELPISKKKVKCKLLTGKEEKAIEAELEAMKKISSATDKLLTTRLKHAIIEADGKSERGYINEFVDNMLARDSMTLRSELRRIAPDIILKQEVKIEGETVKVDIPMTVNFFWPDYEG